MPPFVRRAIAVTAAILALTTLAATSASTPLWVVPDRPTADPARASDTPQPVRVDRETDEPGDLPALGAAALDTIAVILFALLAVVLVVVMWNQRFAGAGRGIRLPRRRRHHGLEPEGPEPPEATDAAPGRVTIDAAAARAALERGEARNAVVACWMQLERDVAVAGLPRHPAETSGEFVRRVIRAASLDPGPIDSLAEQYRRARFSGRPLGDADRAAAFEALDAVVAALPEVRRSPAIAP